MQTHPLRLLLPLAILICTITSCVGPAYVETTPPPPDYSQAPPPPPQQPYYSDQSYSQADAAAAPVSYQTFYNELSPYGQWINTPDYGYVWAPAAGPDFQPYATSGHWVLTDYGWTWVSDYSWGWAPFHYGTWDFDGTIGWFWIPGYQWSPAWVSWRSEPGYYGWAPLGPSYASVGYANYYCPPERYVFVSAGYINSPNISVYYMPRAQNTMYYGRSSVLANTYYDRNSNNTYYAGPQRAEVERYTGTPIRPATLTQAPSPERASYSGGQVSMFRPSVVRPDNNAGARPAPQNVYQRNNITPVAQRQLLTRPNQPRANSFQQENIQHGENNQHPAQQQQPEKPIIDQSNRVQDFKNDQQPPIRQQQNQAVPQQRPVQQQNQVAPQQSPANNQYHAPIQQQQPQQRPVAPQPQNRAPAQPQQRQGMQQQRPPAQQRPAKPQPQPKPAKPQQKPNQSQAPSREERQ